MFQEFLDKNHLYLEFHRRQYLQLFEDKVGQGNRQCLGIDYSFHGLEDIESTGHQELNHNQNQEILEKLHLELQGNRPNLNNH